MLRSDIHPRVNLEGPYTSGIYGLLRILGLKTVILVKR